MLTDAEWQAKMAAAPAPPRKWPEIADWKPPHLRIQKTSEVIKVAIALKTRGDAFDRPRIKKAINNHKRRAELWNEWPYCHWCNCLTDDTDDPHDVREKDKNRATLDHIISRRFSASDADYRARENTVLACNECNQRRNHAENLEVLDGEKWAVAMAGL